MGAMQQMLAAMSAAGAATDPDFANRIALLHFDGADASTTITDVKGPIWTPSGTAQLDTAQARYGPSSLLLNGGASDWVETPDTAAWAFGTGNNFIEASIRPSSLTGNHIILSQWSSTVAARGFILYVTAAGVLTYSVFTTAGSVVTATTGPVIATNTWSDIAAGRIGTLIYVWHNGTRSVTTGNISTNGIQAQNTAIRIGADVNGASRWIGHIDELRVSNIAGPGGNYTPSGPFPDS